MNIFNQKLLVFKLSLCNIFLQHCFFYWRNKTYLSLQEKNKYWQFRIRSFKVFKLFSCADFIQMQRRQQKSNFCPFLIFKTLKVNSCKTTDNMRIKLLGFVFYIEQINSPKSKILFRGHRTHYCMAQWSFGKQFTKNDELLSTYFLVP